MTNGELFIAENPNIEFKVNGSCVWIYFDGVNHYTMPVEWWDKEIGLFKDIKTEIENNLITYGQVIEGMYFSGDAGNINFGLRKALEIIDKNTKVKEQSK